MAQIRQIPAQMTPILWGNLVLLSVLWGGSFFFAEIALTDLPPLTLVWARVACGALFLGLWAVIRREDLSPLVTLWPSFAVMALLNNLVPFGLIFWGQTQIASGLAAILNATTPLFTVVMAHYFTADDKMTWPRLGGVLFGFAGVVVMVGPTFWGQLTADLAAQVAILGAALSYAWAGLYGRRFKGLAPTITACGQVTASTILFLPIVCFVDQPWELPLPSFQVWLAVLGIGILSTALAYLLYFRILAAAGATNLLLVTFLIPVSAMILGVGLLGESISANQWAGMALIGFGLISVDGRLFGAKARKSAPSTEAAKKC